MLEYAKVHRKCPLLFFTSNPLGETDRWLIQKTFAKNESALHDARLIRIHVPLDREPNKTELGKQYKIVEVPTLLLLDPNGRELGRRAGKIAETELPRFLEAAKQAVP
jgi:thiol:disulfide interchange protein